jgi:hypothetical protein
MDDEQKKQEEIKRIDEILTALKENKTKSVKPTKRINEIQTTVHRIIAQPSRERIMTDSEEEDDENEINKNEG